MRLAAEAVTAEELIEYAYDVEDYRVIAPEDGTMYDVAARAEGEREPSPAEFRKMLQALLAERFHLRFHREKRQMAVYALVVDRKGPKLRKSAGKGECSSTAGNAFRGGNYEITAENCEAEDFAEDLNDLDLDRPVVDRTGLKGNFDFHVVFNREGRPEDENGSNVFTAVRQQLGLRLEPQRAAMEVLVVDHVEMASEN
jgi:uncharacterized protein (TIGR03435 family)